MDKTNNRDKDVLHAEDPMKKAEETSEVVHEAANEEAPVPNRDSDEFTDQHLEEPEIDTQVDKVTSEIEEK